jgi:hypothetical protein
VYGGIEKNIFWPPQCAAPLPPKTRFHQAAAAAKLAANAAALPLPHCRYLRRRRTTTAALPPTLPSFPASSLLLLLLPFPLLLPLLLFVDCRLFVPPPLLLTPVSTSPPRRSAVAGWRWWRLLRPCLPLLRCQPPACRHCCRATGKLRLPPQPFPPRCFRQ